ncbi:MAG: hypothetical protein NT033_05460 [Candidatus Omnitrophica bacterium]|nr:hypothetical protein [Candidatus Omnitrophota bacterium]
MKSAGFNPKARWDRHIPEDSQRHDADSLSAKIEVLALFKAGKIYPQSFNWNNKTYPVQRVTYNWQERCGTQIINYFALACGDDLYQVSFNNTSFGWRLEKIL